MNDEEIEIEIGADGQVVVRTIGIKGPRCLDVAEAIAQIVGRVESHSEDRRVFRGGHPGAIARRAAIAPFRRVNRKGDRAMQCPSCRFENMPGLESCGRCGTLLSLSTVTIDVNPPRASKASKRLRKAVPRRLIYRAARPRLRGASGRDSVDRRGLAHPVAGARNTVPSDRPRLGPHALRPGDPRERLPRGLSPTPVARSGGVGVGPRFDPARSGFQRARLLGGGYPGPPGDSAVPEDDGHHVAGLTDSCGPRLRPRGPVACQDRRSDPIQARRRPFQRYDVVLVNEWAYALTAPSARRYRTIQTERTSGGRREWVFVLEEDAAIDRIVGVPGDRVIWDVNHLTINGTPVAWKPLVPERLPKHLDMTVPEGRYMILPTASVGAAKPAERSRSGSLPAWSARKTSSAGPSFAGDRSGGTGS